MQRHLPLLCTLVILSTLAIAILPINAADKSPDDELVTAIYAVADLPVYLPSQGIKTEFQPALLVSLIKAELGPDDWQDKRDSITRHERTRSLVLRTTRTNQKRISTIIESLRRELRPADAQKEAEFDVDDDLEPAKFQAN